MKLKNKCFINYKGPVFDLEVDTEDHSYNIDGVVVHNSVAGSLISYCLEISGLCPIKHGLLFERFTNPERKVMMDIDWDSSEGARDAVLQYLIGKYGQESVCNVPTFGTFGAKSALQAMSRGLRKDTGQDSVLMRKITKLPEIEDIKTDIKDLVEYFKKVRIRSLDPDINNWIDNNQDVIDFAQRIQGQMTQLGVHAGGVVVTPGPIYDFVPVTRGSGNLVAAFREADGSSKDLGELGIIKLDILGLSTLNIFRYCVDHILKDKGIDLSEKIWYLDLDDKNLFAFFMKKSPYGIFQMERAKMFTSKITVDSFDDIVAINALNRPGPLEKYLNKYGYWKDIDKGNIKVSKEELEEIDKERYPFDFMRPVLSKTYGCLLYQEEFMLLVKEAAGFDMGEADNFRRGIAWLPDNPKYHTVEKYFQKLEAGMMDKGYKKSDVDFFVKYCRDFLGYSFNKSHSCVYGYIAYQTLYFKHYYPAYFYAGMINNTSHIDKIQEIISDAKDMGISILPHSIIKSFYETKVESDTSIRLGYGMIKGMGTAVQEELLELKLNECTTLGDVLQKKFKKINSTQFESLIDMGAFDEFNIDRDIVQLLHGLYSEPKIEKWFTRKDKKVLRLEVIPSILKENFDEMNCVKIAMRVKSQPEPWKALLSELIEKVQFTELNKKKYEKITATKQKELLGFNLNASSKVMEMASSFKAIGVLPISEFENENKEYFFLIEKVVGALTKTGKKFLQLTLTDGKQTVKAKCWKELDLKEDEVYRGKLKKDNYGFTLQDKGLIKI